LEFPLESPLESPLAMESLQAVEWELRACRPPWRRAEARLVPSL